MKYILSLLTFFWILSSNAQIAPDTTRKQWNDDTIVQEELAPSIEMMDAPLEDLDMDMMRVTEAVTADDYVEYSFNAFKHNSKLKAVENPDKKASYSLGSGEMLRFIADNIIIPYSYNGLREDEFVLVRVLVGKDSMLYNPEVLFTGGAKFTVNAEEVIEKLPARFNPAMKNGKQVDSYLIIPVRFVARNRNEYPNR